MATQPRVRGAPPAPTTALVGRRREAGRVRQLLGESRIVTLTGPPGVGKTRLALQAASEATRRFPDGVWFVDLAGLRDPGLLANEIATVLGLVDATPRWAVDGLVEHLDGRGMLVILDNCEHLLDACAVLVDSLTRTCPDLRVLATSRQSLGIRAETTLHVAPLGVPGEGSMEGDAIDLLLALAAEVVPDFRAGDADMEAAAMLVRRLDGIPLAIELAAARLKVLTLPQMVERLDERFQLLRGRDRSRPRHQRTLRTALDWSRDLLSEDERRLWRRSAVFRGSFDITAAEAVCASDDHGDFEDPRESADPAESAEGAQSGDLARSHVLDALDGLVDKSIVVATRVGPTMRYRLLESIQDYGLEALQAAGEAPRFQRRHAMYYAALCHEASPHWTRADQPAWFDRLAVEHDELRIALRWFLGHDVPTGCAMAADMWLYWEARAHLTEGRRRFAELLEAVALRDPVRPRTLWVAGYLALAQADMDVAMELLERSRDAAVELDDTASMAFATQYLGLCRLFAGDLSSAEGELELATTLHRAEREGAAAFSLADLAVTVMLAGDLPRAVSLYEEVLEVTEDDGDPWTRSHALWGLGVALFRLGDLDRAGAAEEEALDLVGQLDERSGVALCLEALAWVSAGRGDLVRAATLQGASAAVWASIPRSLPEPLKDLAGQCRAAATTGLGASRQQRLFEQGHALSSQEAVAFGLGRSSTGSAGPGAPPADADRAVADRAGTAESVLTPREAEVADLVAAGMTDREIAGRLVVSPRTIESHVQHILVKLGFRSRTQLAAWVTRHQAN